MKKALAYLLSGILIGLGIDSFSVPTRAQKQYNTSDLTDHEVRSILERQLRTSKDPDEASMEEISARHAWVHHGWTLPADVRERTILRARSNKPDKVKVLGFTVEDTGPAKQALCIAIIGKDDELRSRQSEQKQ